MTFVPPDDNNSVSRKRSTPRTDRVYTVLYSRITCGEFVADQRLPTEHDLATDFGVSRPVVRDALERLRREGLIYSRQGAGSFVRDQPRAKPTLGFAPVETIADIQRSYEFRLTIEPDAAFYAAKRHNEAVLNKIRVSLQALVHATQNQQHRDDVDFAFHLAIAEASNNHYYVSSILALKDHITVGMKLHGQTLLFPEPSRLEPVLEEHAELFSSIERRDGKRARELMEAHLAGSRDRLFGGRLLDLTFTD